MLKPYRARVQLIFGWPLLSVRFRAREYRIGRQDRYQYGFISFDHTHRNEHRLRVFNSHPMLYFLQRLRCLAIRP